MKPSSIYFIYLSVFFFGFFSATALPEPENRNVKPEQVVKNLKEKGIEVNIEEARQILDLMYLLAGIVCNPK